VLAGHHYSGCLVAGRKDIAGAVFGSEEALQATYWKIGPHEDPTYNLCKLTQEDISKAIVLAGMGAIVSFGVMLLLKVLIRRLRRLFYCRGDPQSGTASRNVKTWWMPGLFIVQGS
jgi:hypothetical protein